VSEVERVLRKHYYFALDPSRCMGCGEHLPCDGEVDDEHRAHVAEQVEALFVERVRAAQAEALRDTAERADSIGHHWSGVTAHAFFDFASDLRDRIAQDAPESAPTAPRPPAELLGRIEGLEGNQR
jgi:hypothetical protein